MSVNVLPKKSRLEVAQSHHSLIFCLLKLLEFSCLAHGHLCNSNEGGLFNLSVQTNKKLISNGENQVVTCEMLLFTY